MAQPSAWFQQSACIMWVLNRASRGENGSGFGLEAVPPACFVCKISLFPQIQPARATFGNEMTCRALEKKMQTLRNFIFAERV